MEISDWLFIRDERKKTSTGTTDNDTTGDESNEWMEP